MNPQTIATAYIETWNQTAAEARNALLEQHWIKEASYVDPLMAGNGRAEISHLMAAVHERFPSFKFALRGEPDGYGEYVRLSWSFGSHDVTALMEGFDVVQVAGDKIQRVIGFIDRAPTG